MCLNILDQKIWKKIFWVGFYMEVKKKRGWAYFVGVKRGPLEGAERNNSIQKQAPLRGRKRSSGF
jgi:hypothetical protein